MTIESDLDWASVKFVFYDTGSNAKSNLYTLLKFIDQRFVNLINQSTTIYLIIYFIAMLKLQIHIN